MALTLAAAALQMLGPSVRPRTTFEAVWRMAPWALLCFPVGFWLGQTAPGGRRMRAKGVVLGLAMASAVAGLQAWVAGISPDVGGVAVSFLGVWAGILSGAPQT